MKNKWIAVQIKENNKFYAYIIRVTERDNLIAKLKIDNIVSANIYTVKKEAKSTVETWNEHFKTNGNHMFDDILF